MDHYIFFVATKTSEAILAQQHIANVSITPVTCYHKCIANWW